MTAKAKMKLVNEKLPTHLRALAERIESGIVEIIEISSEVNVDKMLTGGINDPVAEHSHTITIRFREKNAGGSWR